MILILILLTLIVVPNVKAQQTIIPPVIPLAVRSPYLTCWNNHSNNAVIGDSWPTTFNDTQILGWSVLVRVDGLTYSFLGATVVTGQAGHMQVNLTFLNPIEPQDWVKQSIPFSYLAFTANSLDGARHAVQVYSDVSGGTSNPSSEPVVSFQLRFRVELGGSNEEHFVEPVVRDVIFRKSAVGSNYPNVSISNSNHSQGVEQTGNMLIMTYAYARASGDESLISRYYSLLTSWANYLNASVLFNNNQHSADDLSVSNQTNLAIKGIIAIEAMSKMSSVVNHTADANKYSNGAANLYAQWKSLALSSDQHLLAAYGQNNSWTLGYNLFADVWLGTNLVESSVYNGHSNFIENIVLTSNFSNFGMPVDSLSTDTSVAVSSCSLFAAAMTTNQGLSSDLISKVSNRASSTNTSGVFPVYYGSGDGTTVQGVASPAQGAVFAPLVLKASVLPINANGTTGKPRLLRKRNIGAIVGGIIGGVSAIFAVIGVVIFVQRRRRRVRPKSVLSSSDTWEAGLHAIIVTPFDPNLNSSEGTRDTGFLPEQQPLVDENPDTELVALHRPSSSPPDVLPLPQPVVPVPVGLSDQEIARLRAQTLGSQQFQAQTRSTSNVSQPETAATESGEASSSYDNRRLHSEVEFESLRREMERLRAEGLVNEAPPSYTEGDR
ncbi:hypothetical protein F5888DRAFT_1906874 [Russula emetica]|nr:hypothetical protein F5888DRAFT_1906874 [Russula emetica]